MFQFLINITKFSLSIIENLIDNNYQVKVI